MKKIFWQKSQKIYIYIYIYICIYIYIYIYVKNHVIVGKKTFPHKSLALDGITDKLHQVTDNANSM
jgi:hypothetical protein